MRSITNYVTFDKHLAELKRLIEALDASAPQAFLEAMKSLLTAIAYKDVALLQSHLTAALEAFQQSIQDEIRMRLTQAGIGKESCHKLLGLLRDHPFEQVEELGKLVEWALDRMLRTLADLRDGPVVLLTENGREVEDADQLDRAIEELQELKKGVFENWPSSDHELPPVDRKMVAESRAAFRHQGGERIEDLIRRLGGDCAKDG